MRNRAVRPLGMKPSWFSCFQCKACRARCARGERRRAPTPHEGCATCLFVGSFRPLSMGTRKGIELPNCDLCKQPHMAQSAKPKRIHLSRYSHVIASEASAKVHRAMARICMGTPAHVLGVLIADLVRGWQDGGDFRYRSSKGNDFWVPAVSQPSLRLVSGRLAKMVPA